MEMIRTSTVIIKRGPILLDEEYEESDWVEALAEALQPEEEEPP